VHEGLAIEFAFETESQHRLHSLAQWLQVSGVCRKFAEHFGPILNVSAGSQGTFCLRGHLLGRLAL